MQVEIWIHITGKRHSHAISKLSHEETDRRWINSWPLNLFKILMIYIYFIKKCINDNNNRFIFQAISNIEHKAYLGDSPVLILIYLGVAFFVLTLFSCGSNSITTAVCLFVCLSVCLSVTHFRSCNLIPAI